MFKCPECASTKVFQFVSVGAKQELNGRNKIYEYGHGGTDNVFETCGCEACGWEGNIYEVKET